MSCIYVHAFSMLKQGLSQKKIQKVLKDLKGHSRSTKHACFGTYMYSSEDTKIPEQWMEKFNSANLYHGKYETINLFLITYYQFQSIIVRYNLVPGGMCMY